MKLLFSIVIAAALWFLMFSPWTVHLVNFWLTMSVSAVILILLSAYLGKNFRKQFSFNGKDVCIGIVSAAVLWGVFYIGDWLSTLMFNFAKPQVSLIYGMKEGENPLALAILLLLLIGPAEELFWRGFIQRKFSEKFGAWIAFFATAAIYALVHIWSFNFMLVMAALVCGGFWGLLYKWNKNILTLVISHALWDVAVFVVFPIM
ncbi:MAG: CPBP family intramembrane metalloprotease [Bacteroidales bacterium]|jgi:membrane protease YdiL (CAAX protease family)|nr:CPBP family intramembrane metalloprotease [Bacteroidales bacterium]